MAHTHTPSVKTKVAIIGAGPAGAALAAFLTRKGVSVAIFDDGARPPLIVGESLVPQLIPIFRQLGIEDDVAKIGVHKPGVTVTFTPEEELRLSFTAVRGVLPTYAYNVPRKEFDALILRTALESGARYVETSAKCSAEKSPNPAHSRMALSPETLALVPEWKGHQPDLLIDASGRRRIFSKLLGLGAAEGKRKDVSHFAHYENCPPPDPPGTVITIRMEQGWAWRIPLTEGRLSIGIVVNKEVAKKSGATPEEQLENILSKEPRIARDCSGRRRVSKVATFANYQLISECGSGQNWAMVGDAFGFVDPMLSPGLCMAMVSAEKLARIIPADPARCRHLPRRLTAYWHWYAKTLSAWQNLVDHFYDGRIFAIQRSGTDMAKRYPGRFSDFMERHISKNLSGMAAGAYINRPYSRWLLSMLAKYGIRGYNPSDFAVR